MPREPHQNSGQQQSCPCPLANAFLSNSISGRIIETKIAGAGIEPANSWFKATDFYQQKLPRMTFMTTCSSTAVTATVLVRIAIARLVGGMPPAVWQALPKPNRFPSQRRIRRSQAPDSTLTDPQISHTVRALSDLHAAGRTEEESGSCEISSGPHFY